MNDPHVRSGKTMGALCVALVLFGGFFLPLSPSSSSGIGLPLAVAHADTTSTATPPSTSASQPDLPSCNILEFSFQTCIWQPLLSLLVAVIVQPAVLFVTVASMLFNWLVTHTIIDFHDWYTGVQQAVTTAWSAFRDISNILIIGIFTFIAISIILGLQEFGQKKFIARVLIVAVLINFSLLFAQMIVDASNYFAFDLYCTAQIGGSNCSGTAQSQTATTANAAPSGISGQFLHFMGLNTLADSYSTAQKIAAGNAWWMAIVYALLAFAILVGAGLILFYGCFLLMSRAVLILILFVTAAIAFASHLVPAWDKSHYGWNTWWSSLIKSAVMAPVLIFFLWITLAISQDLPQNTGGSLADLAINPTSGSNVQLLFDCFLILGLLFATFKISNMFASTVAGFDVAQNLAAAPFTLGARLAGIFGTGLIGGLAFNQAKGLTTAAKGASAEAAVLRMQQQAAFNRNDHLAAAGFGNDASVLEQRAAALAKKAASKERLAGSNFNLMNTGAAKAVTKAIGIKGIATGASGGSFYEKSYADQVKERSEAAQKVADKAKASDEDIKKKFEERENRTARREQLQATKDSAKVTADAVKQPIEELLKAAKDKQQGAENNREKDQRVYDQQISHEVQQLRTANAAYNQDKTALETEEQERQHIMQIQDRAQRERDLQTQAQRINDARERIQNFEDNDAAANLLRTLRGSRTTNAGQHAAAVDEARNEAISYQNRLNELNRPVEAADKALKDFENETERFEKASIASGKEVAQNIGEIAATQGDILKRTLGAAQDEDVANATKDLIKKKQGKQSQVAEMLKEINTDGGGGGGH